MSVLLESGAWFSRVLALVEAGLLVDYSASMWVNIRVRLHIVFTLQIPLRNEI